MSSFPSSKRGETKIESGRGVEYRAYGEAKPYRQKNGHWWSQKGGISIRKQRNSETTKGTTNVRREKNKMVEKGL